MFCSEKKTGQYGGENNESLRRRKNKVGYLFVPLISIQKVPLEKFSMYSCDVSKGLAFLIRIRIVVQCGR